MRASRTTRRHASTTSAGEASNASTSSSTRSRSSCRAIRRAAGALSTRVAPSTSAASAGIRASRAERVGSPERRAGRLRPEATDRDPRDRQLVDGPIGGREGREVERGERPLGVVETTDQEEPADLEVSRIRGVHSVTVLLERRPGPAEGLRRPAQVAGGERDLGLGDHATGAGQRLLRAEGPRRAPQEGLRPNKIAELRHRDATQRERRRVVPQARPASGPRGDHPRRGPARQR